MPDFRNFSWRAGLPLVAALLVWTVVAVMLQLHSHCPAMPGGPSDDWDIPQLVAYLNARGLGLRLVSGRKDGLLEREAFLTTTDRSWADLNELPKVRQFLHLWSGTLFCQRKRGESDRSSARENWGDCYLETGPFLLFGDRELLARVRAAFGPPLLSGDLLADEQRAPDRAARPPMEVAEGKGH
jgi:hypothetical protein